MLVNAGQVFLISHGRRRAETPTGRKHREEGQGKQEHREQQDRQNRTVSKDINRDYLIINAAPNRMKKLY